MGAERRSAMGVQPDGERDLAVVERPVVMLKLLSQPGDIVLGHDGSGGRGPRLRSGVVEPFFTKRARPILRRTTFLRRGACAAASSRARRRRCAAADGVDD